MSGQHDEQKTSIHFGNSTPLGYSYSPGVAYPVLYI